MPNTLRHGVFWKTLPTLYRLTQTADADVPVIVGTWPVHRIVGGAANVNKVYLALDPGSTLAAFGFDTDWQKWTGCEFFYACFTLFNQYNKPSPVLINVFNPLVHFTAVTASQLTQTAGVITILATTADVIIDSVVVKNTAGSVTLVKGVNYLTGYDAFNNFLITILDTSPTTTYTVSYNKANVAAVTATTIIGGTDGNNVNSGLECIEDVFPQLTVVPGILYAPGWSNNSLVAIAADARVQLINGVFRARTIVDADNLSTARSPQGAVNFKSTNAIVDSRQDLIWPPCCTAGPLQFHAGTIISILEGVVTQTRGNGIPYWSVSNNLMPIDGVCLADGTPIVVRPNDANFLNGSGIMSMIQYEGGWFAWGNRTAAYPIANDVTLVFAIVQRELDWIGNSIALTLRPFVDNPTNTRLIQSITLTEQIWLSSLVSSGALLKGLIEFLQVDNPVSSLLNARITFHYLLTPPLPAEDIENNLEFDVTGLQNLFSVVASSAQIGTASGGGLTVS
jgi:phage tail sheath protein FI